MNTLQRFFDSFNFPVMLATSWFTRCILFHIILLYYYAGDCGCPAVIYLKETFLDTIGTELFPILGGGGVVRIEPSQQLLDDCTHKRNNKRKVGKTEIVFSSAFQKSTFQRQNEAGKKFGH